jgi:hypothetical protein
MRSDCSRFAEAFLADRLQRIDRTIDLSCSRRVRRDGALRADRFGDSIGRYEDVGAEIESQVAALRRYFLCSDCDTAFRLPDEEVAAEVQTSFGFVDEAISKGRCRDCCDGSNI